MAGSWAAPDLAPSWLPDVARASEIQPSPSARIIDVR